MSRSLKFRVAALACLVVLDAAACGARLDSKQREVALQAYAAGGGAAGAGQPGAAPTVGASAGPGTGASTGPSTGASGAPGGGGAAASCSGTGNKATDTGVTHTQIVLGTVSDLSGIQPGLFKSTTDAVAAASAYINSQGGICGRQIKPVPYDTQETSSGNKAATQDACSKSFALVGSMSAFDDGGAPVVNSCGIPDVTAITTNSQPALNKNTYAVYQGRPDQYLQGTARFIKQKYPDVITHAAIMWLNSPVPKTNATVRKKGEEQNGFKFVYVKEVQVVERNYTSYVIQMKNAGVKYVTMVASKGRRDWPRRSGRRLAAPARTCSTSAFMEYSLADLFESVADAIPDREALICGDRRLTYQQLDQRATRIGNHLREAGVKPGEHVGLYLYNGTEYVETVLGCLKVRAVPINVNYRYVEHELRYLFNNADLVGVLYQQEFVSRIAAVRDDVPTLRHFLYLEDGTGGSPGPEGAVGYDEALDGGSAARDFDPRSGDDLFIIYTGGTTGLPRGVMWRQEDMFFSAMGGGNPTGPPVESPEQLAENATARPAVVQFPIPPLIHGASTLGVFIGLNWGDRVVLIRKFDPELAWEMVDR
jgi:ABC-type branched-subunit amino acid transport system substrate-binding protein